MLPLILGVLLLVVLDGDGADQPSPTAGGCEKVTILSAVEGTPGDRYAKTLERLLDHSGKGWTAEVEDTDGSADNLLKLKELKLKDEENANCTLAVVLFTTAVDATEGVYQFTNNDVRDLRIVGPFDDALVHLIVRDSQEKIEKVSDLCGKIVSVGPKNSGTEQFAKVLLRDECPQEDPYKSNNLKVNNALVELQNKNLDAVLWVSIVPTPKVREIMSEDRSIHLVPLGDPYRQKVQVDWDDFYGKPGNPRRRRPPTVYPGRVYGSGTILPVDYPGVLFVPTITVPNGLVAMVDTDPELVAFVTRALFDHGQEFVRELRQQSGGGAQNFPAARSVYENPAYCYVQLHPSAAAYYKRVLGGPPPCPREPVGPQPY